MTDPPGHDFIRNAMAPPLRPGAVAELRGGVDEAASGLFRDWWKGVTSTAWRI